MKSSTSKYISSSRCLFQYTATHHSEQKVGQREENIVKHWQKGNKVLEVEPTHPFKITLKAFLSKVDIFHIEIGRKYQDHSFSKERTASMASQVLSQMRM